MPPTEFADIADDLCRSGEVSCVREALMGSPFLHADVVYQVSAALQNCLVLSFLPIVFRFPDRRIVFAESVVRQYIGPLIN